MRRRRALTASTGIPAVAFLTFSLGACASDQMVDPRRMALAPSEPSAAKTVAGPSVSGTNPSYGNQGTTLDVQVMGSGFASGAQATWLLNDVPDTHIRTNHTTFVSSTQITVNITIDATAEVAFRDVQVSLVGGKNGVGSDAFEVTSAQVLGAQGANKVAGPDDLLEIGGYTGSSEAYVIDASRRFIDLGAGQVWAMAPRGGVAVGRDENSNAIVWTRQGDGSWSPQPLPSAPNSAQRTASSAAYAPDGTLLVGGWDATAGKHGSLPFNRPVVWARVGGVWSAPTMYVLPAGSQRASAHAVSGSGELTGEVDAGASGAVWDSPTVVTALDGVGYAINSGGTLVVGTALGAPAYWWRDPSTGAWHATSVRLPSIAGTTCPNGVAQGMNDAGVIVGFSCNAAGGSQATVWTLDLSSGIPALVGGPRALPGLGAKPSTADLSFAAGVSQSPPYTVVGRAAAQQAYLAVQWVLP